MSVTKYIVAVDLNDPPAEKKKRYFHLVLPSATEPDFYRQTVSFNAFFRGLKRRNRSPSTLYIAYDEDLLTAYLRERFSSHKVLRFDSIWDFYKAVGYNHRKNSWVVAQPVERFAVNEDVTGSRPVDPAI